jgi:hypothetical protein
MGWIYLKNWNQLPPTQQQTPNSCWAACGSALSTYFANSEGKGTSRNQNAIANGIGANINNVASMEDVLTYIGCYSAAGEVEVDEANLPNRQEIAEELRLGRPIVVGINRAGLKNPQTDQLRGGHYMILIGVEDATGDLYIMDPSQGNLQHSDQFSYSKNSYNAFRFAKSFYTRIPS